MQLRGILLCGGALALLAACGPGAGGAGNSTPSGIAQDINAARNQAPTSARPGQRYSAGARSLAPLPVPPPTPPAAPVAPVPPAAMPPSVALGGFSSQAQRPGNAALGHRFALDNCRPCHVVASDQSSPVRFADAPEFRAIANMASTTPVSLTIWLTNPHPTMPSLKLSPEEAANVIAYIETLRDHHSGAGRDHR